METDIPLEGKEKEEAINILKRTKFENFEVHPHYYNLQGLPRHGITLEKAKEIYSNYNKIIMVYKRPANHGYKYAFIYKLNKKDSYHLLFFLDEKPMKIFNAYHSRENIEKRLMKKFGF